MAGSQMSFSASWQDSGAPGRSLARGKAFDVARRHSRRVRLLRVLLPAAGVAAVAGFFVLTRLGLPTALDLSAARLSITPNAVIMEHPNISGFDGEQREYSVVAARAIQPLANPDQVRLEEIKATITAAGLGTTVVTAGSGSYDHGARTLRLEGNIAVDSAEGYALRMTDADLDFLAGTMRSANAVTVTYADSETTAQRFLATDGGKHIRFEGGVRTTIIPPKRETEPAAPAKAAE
jgi:lipopolysaccharide export system protein LptC